MSKRWDIDIRWRRNYRNKDGSLNEDAERYLRLCTEYGVEGSRLIQRLMLDEDQIVAARLRAKAELLEEERRLKEKKMRLVAGEI